MKRTDLKSCKRIVVKIGSSLLNRDNPVLLEGIVHQINQLRQLNKEIVVVSSGAIYFGLSCRQNISPPVTLPQKQATAAIGQPLLMNFYSKLFEKYQILTAQVLLTQTGIGDRESYLNASNTLNTLLEMGTIPIVNENDTVATEEIQFGDNDTLSVLVTTLADADLLIILSDVQGLYPGPPTEDSQPLTEVPRITGDIRKMAGPADPRGTTVGGMLTKIKAAETATSSGIPMLIASGHEKNILNKIIQGDQVGTFFPPATEENLIRGRKRWIGYHLLPKGTIQVDQGAAEALKKQGKSLLPSGIKRAEGLFERGDVVKIVDHNNREFARGMTNYSLQEIQQLKGCQSSEISAILGTHYYDEIIHRDNLVVFSDDC